MPEYKFPLPVGTCLIDNFGKSVYKIVSLVNVPWDPQKRNWYKIRQFDTGLPETIPENYIPYSYSVVQCPAQEIPKPPAIKVGDTVRWKVKKGYTKGTVIHIADDGEVTCEIEEKMYGVKGTMFPDIYELEAVEAWTKTQDPHWLTVDELKAICRKKGLPDSGNKEDLIRRLK